MDESIKEYLRHIGSKGGKAVAGTPQAKARAAKAAKARWAKRKQKKSEKRKFTYGTLIFGAIALAALGCMIGNPSNWVAWIIFVVFAWLTWPSKRKPGIRDYHSKRTLPAQ